MFTCESTHYHNHLVPGFISFLGGFHTQCSIPRFYLFPKTMENLLLSFFQTYARQKLYLHAIQMTLGSPKKFFVNCTKHHTEHHSSPCLHQHRTSLRFFPNAPTEATSLGPLCLPLGLHLSFRPPPRQARHHCSGLAQKAAAVSNLSHQGYFITSITENGSTTEANEKVDMWLSLHY